MYSHSIFEALKNITDEVNGVSKNRPNEGAPEYGFWLVSGYADESPENLVLRVSVCPQVLDNGSNIEPESLKVDIHNPEKLNDDFQAVIKHLRAAAKPSSEELRQYENLCLKRGFNIPVARIACEAVRQGLLFVAEELEKAELTAKTGNNS